jgi:hypothetical protein
METNSKIPAAILGMLLAAGLAGAGYFVSTTVYKGRLASNAVTVKGFAEQDVKADLALWQIGYSVTGKNLADVYARSQANEKTLTDFLMQKGFAAGDVKAGGLRLTDTLANEYRARDAGDSDRYILNNSITVRSANVALVDSTTHALNDVIKDGIVLTNNNVDFQYTKLNDIKAPMLRAATQNARDSAQQFANDANSAVGSIQSANQGFFSIVSRDAADAGTNEGGYSGPPMSTIDKKVRVVVTLTYYLER